VAAWGYSPVPLFAEPTVDGFTRGVPLVMALELLLVLIATVLWAQLNHPR
jgi:hypothetical protein